MSEYKEISLHPFQAKAFQSNARFVAMVSGTGAGKTFSGPPWMYREIAAHPGKNWMVISPSYKLLNRTTMSEFLSFFEGTELEGRMNRTDKEYTLPDGGKVYFCSAERPDLLEGGQMKGIWADESGQMRRWVWVVIQARLGVEQGRALLTSTPYGKNWFYWDFFKRWEDGDPDYFCVQFDSTANPKYSEEEFVRMKRILSDAEFNMRYRGHFTELEGLVYPDFTSCLTESDQVRIPKPGDVRIGGIDFGWTAPTAALTAFIDSETQKLIVYREFYRTHQQMSQLAQHLDLDTTYYADPSSPKEIDELRNEGIKVELAENTYVPGLRKVSEYLRDDRILIHRKVCPNLVSEAGSLTDPKGNDQKNRSAEDHLLDCLRYLVMGADLGKPLNIYILETMGQEQDEYARFF